MKFTKMEGIGNDYVYVDCTKTVLSNPSELSIRVSDRHFGIGSDGLILIKSSDVADFFMEMYNADGSQGKMCGNGIRCVGKYVYDNGLTTKTTVKVDTLSGIKSLQLHTGTDGKVESVTVDMGEPILKPADVPVDIKVFTTKSGEIPDADKPLISSLLNVDGNDYKVTCVSVGNPHAIVFVPETFNLQEFKIEDIGPLFEKHKAFPEQVNTEFVQIIDRQNLNMRVWERGSGETLACGTGACASFVAASLNGYCDDTATLHLIGGDLKITWDKDKNTIFMEGAATTVFTGEIEE